MDFVHPSANIANPEPARYNSLVIEVTGEEDKIDALYNLLRRFGVKELMRTGRVAMVRGAGEGRGIRTKQETNGRTSPYPEDSIL